MDSKQPLCLVTGANSGIGYATAVQLANQGCKVLMVCRDHQKGKQAKDRIINATSNPNIELLVTDLSSQQAIIGLIQDIKRNYPTLQILINNAGAIFRQHELTVDGIENTWALNHMAYFMLATGLLDTLQTNSPARIVNVGSFAAKGSEIHFSDLQGTNNYDRVLAYQQSKRANILFTTELARRIDSQYITVNCYNPGNVMTQFGGILRNLKIMTKRILSPGRYQAMNLVPVEQPGKDLAYLALDASLRDTNGIVFSGRQVDPSLNALDNVDVAQQLWNVSEDLLQYPLS